MIGANVMMISSVNTYTTNMKMQMKWQQKKTSGDYTADGAMSIEEQLRKQAQEMNGGFNSSSKVSLSTIQAKMMAGKKLSAEEMQYLQENHPETYKKAKAIEMEREAYERELKQCRTKEEVQRVKLSHAAASMAQVKNIESNPNIPEGAKLGLMLEQLWKANALGDTARAFMESGDYKRLPTEEERRQAEEDLKEAQEAERGIEDKTDDTPKEVMEDALADAEEKGEMEAAEGETTAPVAGTQIGEGEPDMPPVAEKAQVVAETDAKKVIAEKRRMTRLEAEVTPEARKVKRAKAQAAYTKISFSGNLVGCAVDVKK